MCMDSDLAEMKSCLMLSIGQWDQIYPKWQVLNYSFILNVCWSSFAYYYQSVIGIFLSLFQSDPIEQLPLYVDLLILIQIFAWDRIFAELSLATYFYLVSIPVFYLFFLTVNIFYSGFIWGEYHISKCCFAVNHLEEFKKPKKKFLI